MLFFRPGLRRASFALAALPSLLVASCSSFGPASRLPAGRDAAGGTSVAGAAGGDATQAALVEPCSSNRQCAARLTAANGGVKVPAMCLAADQRCVALTSPDCPSVTGDYEDEHAIAIGALFSLQGSASVAESPWHRSAMLAVTEIDAAGGIPKGGSSSSQRPLVLVSCSSDADLARASAHLIDALKVPAILGPSGSQDTLDLSRTRSIEAGVLVVSPTAVAASLADLSDRDLTWQMAPSDLQRAPLLLQQIGQLEAELAPGRAGEPLRLGVIYRDDALGVGTRAALASLQINGRPLADPSNLGSRVRVDGYDDSAPDQAELVRKQLELMPDIIVLAGSAEAVGQILLPIELGWPEGAGAAPRPHYVLTDSAKLPALLAAAAQVPGLNTRVRGIGVRPAARTQAVFDGFLIDYAQAFGESADVAGMGSTYDAAYALAYAIAAMTDGPIDGQGLAGALRRLSDGTREIAVGPTTVLGAFHELGTGHAIHALGSMAPLQWDESGAIAGGLLEVWCIGPGGADGAAAFRSSGVTYDLATEAVAGSFDSERCGASVAVPDASKPPGKPGPTGPAPGPLPAATCGNGRVDPGEQCDGGEGCTATCRDQNAAATSCRDILVGERAHDPRDACDVCRCQQCADEVIACYRDEQSTLKAVLCTVAAECAWRTGCIDEGCLCGSAMSCMPPSGACAIEFFAAAETPDVARLNTRVSDPNFAIGRVSTLGACVQRSCATECATAALVR